MSAFRLGSVALENSVQFVELVNLFTVRFKVDEQFIHRLEFASGALFSLVWPFVGWPLIWLPDWLLVRLLPIGDELAELEFSINKYGFEYEITIRSVCLLFFG